MSKEMNRILVTFDTIHKIPALHLAIWCFMFTNTRSANV